MLDWSLRAQLTARRSYHRPLDMDNPTTFESWGDVCTRVINHQRWLWQRALERPLNRQEETELEELYGILYSRKALVAGRTLWLGGTPISQFRECSQFNCAYLGVRTVYDIVDAFWLLLNGCGVTPRPVVGNLWGFSTPIKHITVIPSTRGPHDRGRPTNTEVYSRSTRAWTIQVGDSAEAWAKLPGKILAGKHRHCDSLTLDYSQIRGGGSRLRGYGWIGAGYKPLATAMSHICEIMNDRAGQMLTFGNLHDILNLLGTVLSTRRSAEMVLCSSSLSPPTLHEFITFKKDMYANGKGWREQSNNTVDWDTRPTYNRILDQLILMAESGGSEPGIRNAIAALKRAPWQHGTNPCGEILLPDKGFCNLVEINLAAYLAPDRQGDVGFAGCDLFRDARLIARANYRQTLVNLEDGVLQRAWHENNQNLRLCGIGITGIAQAWDCIMAEYRDAQVHHHSSLLQLLNSVCWDAIEDMADELGTQHPALATTVKPSGTLSKVMDCTEGFHYPLARYILNKIVFSKDDPLVRLMADAGVQIEPHPSKESDVLASIPVDNGVEPVAETAVQQLDRYKLLMDTWCDHNVSCTIYYNRDELESIARWLDANWDHYVAVSFLPRPPALPTSDQARALGYAYLPQSIITKEQYDEIVSRIKPIDFGSWGQLIEEAPARSADSGGVSECSGGSCPIR